MGALKVDRCLYGPDFSKVADEFVTGVFCSVFLKVAAEVVFYTKSGKGRVGQERL